MSDVRFMCDPYGYLNAAERLEPGNWMVSSPWFKKYLHLMDWFKGKFAGKPHI